MGPKMRKCLLIFLLLVIAFPLIAQDWAEIQKKTIRFYRYQRAGVKGKHCHNPFYEDIQSGWPHENDSYNGKDLSGGWYDAGDFVKFGLPFSSTVYILLKGYDVFPNSYDDNDSWDKFNTKDGIPDILNEVKFATDYILKAVINNSTVVYDIGDGNADHSCPLNGCGGPTNSSSVGNRPVRFADGADVPGLYAASLALMSILYREFDADYADSCLNKAKEAYQAGWSKRSKGVSTPNGSFYAPKEGIPFIWHDKMMAGAVELYRATGDQKYKEDLNVLGAESGTMHNHIGYTNVAPIVAFEMYRQGLTQQRSELADHVAFLLSKVLDKPDNPSMDGVYFNQHWGMAGGTACAAFTAALAYVLDPQETYKNFAEKQLKWVSGTDSNAKRSWIVGYNNGPTAIHHRNALWKPSVKIEGALVSGPDENGNYSDNAEAYEYTEVALDYNAGIPGAVAFMKDLNDPSTVKVTTALADNAVNVYFSKTPTVQYTATLSKATSWKLVLTGSKSGATKVFSGTGSNISVSWNGEADEGIFIIQDEVMAKLEVENLAIYHMSRTRETLEIKDIKAPPFKKTDVLVDNFDDGDYFNKHSGIWSVFTDEPLGGNSSTYPKELTEENTTEGESGLGLNVQLIKKNNIEHSFAGIRMTFNKEGTAVSLGNAKSIVFDYKCNKSNVGKSFYFEVVQSDITDSAYYGKKITIPNELWNRVRIPLNTSALSVKPWHTDGENFSLNSVTAFQLVNYESDNVNITIDSVFIEDLKIGDPIAVKECRKVADGTIVKRMNSVFIPVKFLDKDNNYVEVMDMQGKRIKKIQINKNNAIQSLEIKLNTLSNGLYLVRIINDNRETVALPVMVNR